MRTSRFLTTLLLSAVALQVSHDALAQSPERPQLVGTWEWVFTRGGFAGASFTPASEGYDIQIEFRDTGRARVFQDLELLVETNYVLVQTMCGWTVNIGLTSPFPHPPIQDPWVFCVATRQSEGDRILEATDVCCDRYWSQYVVRDPVAVSPSTWAAVKELYKNRD